MEKLGVRCPFPSSIAKNVLLLPGSQLPNMLDAKRTVNQQLGGETSEAIVLRREWLIMPGVHVLHHRPGRPAHGKTTLGRSSPEERCTEGFDLLPRARWLCRVEPCPDKGVLVVIQDGLGGVERHGIQAPLLAVVT